MHDYFIDRLLRVFTDVLTAAIEAGEADADVNAYGLLRGIGNLCAGAGDDARRLFELLRAGLEPQRLA